MVVLLKFLYYNLALYIHAASLKSWYEKKKKKDEVFLPLSYKSKNLFHGTQEPRGKKKKKKKKKQNPTNYPHI